MSDPLAMVSRIAVAAALDRDVGDERPAGDGEAGADESNPQDGGRARELGHADRSSTAADVVLISTEIPLASAVGVIVEPSDTSRS